MSETLTSSHPEQATHESKPSSAHSKVSQQRKAKRDCTAVQMREVAHEALNDAVSSWRHKQWQQTLSAVVVSAALAAALMLIAGRPQASLHGVANENLKGAHAGMSASSAIPRSSGGDDVAGIGDRSSADREESDPTPKPTTTNDAGDTSVQHRAGRGAAKTAPLSQRKPPYHLSPRSRREESTGRPERLPQRPTQAAELASAYEKLTEAEQWVRQRERLYYARHIPHSRLIAAQVELKKAEQSLAKLHGEMVEAARLALEAEVLDAHRRVLVAAEALASIRSETGHSETRDARRQAWTREAKHAEQQFHAALAHRKRHRQTPNTHRRCDQCRRLAL